MARNERFENSKITSMYALAILSFFFDGQGLSRSLRDSELACASLLFSYVCAVLIRVAENVENNENTSSKLDWHFI